MQYIVYYTRTGLLPPTSRHGCGFPDRILFKENRSVKNTRNPSNPQRYLPFGKFNLLLNEEKVKKREEPCVQKEKKGGTTSRHSIKYTKDRDNMNQRRKVRGIQAGRDNKKGKKKQIKTNDCRGLLNYHFQH